MKRTVTCNTDSIKDIHQEHINFDLTDDKGRSIGADILIREFHYIESATGIKSSEIIPGRTYYTMFVQATRNEKPFGTCGQSKLYASLSEAQSAAKGRVQDTRQRYQSKFACK
jgi:hypothetical protein